MTNTEVKLVLQTKRLNLRHFSLTDASFVLELVNEASWLRYIGDKGVKDLGAARDYISNGPVNSYNTNGFGFYLVETKQELTPIGMCGIIKRDTLDDVDIGFAFLPKFWGQGYAYESSNAVLEYAKNDLGFAQMSAIVSPGNSSSIKLLEKLKFQFQKQFSMQTGDSEVKLFLRAL